MTDSTHAAGKQGRQSRTRRRTRRRTMHRKPDARHRDYAIRTFCGVLPPSRPRRHWPSIAIARAIWKLPSTSARARCDQTLSQLMLPTFSIPPPRRMSHRDKAKNRPFAPHVVPNPDGMLVIRMIRPGIANAWLHWPSGSWWVP